ncbi:MAG: Hsp20/alpha crystallin family protein [Desulfobulbaceae bacterium]
MTDKKQKTELVTKEETRPDTYFGEMERYFDRFFRHPFSLMNQPWPFREVPGMGDVSPSVDIFEEGGDMVVKAELPGISKENLNVTITENTLTITGEKKQEEKVEKKNYHRIERSYGSFTRSFRLPDNVNSDKAKASFKDGVLEVRVPKTKETKQKKITVS